MRRSRAWLQDKLWSDRATEQGAASLRQVLVEIRRALGAHRDALVADAGWIGFDPERIVVKIVPSADDWAFSGEPPEFAEGLDVPDAEFEDWIRDQRSAYADRLASGPTRGAPGKQPGATGTTEFVAPDADRAERKPLNDEPAESAEGNPGLSRGPRRRLHWIPLTTAAGLLLLVASIVTAALWLPPRLETREAAVAEPFGAHAIPSVAVLQFHSLGGTPAQQNWVDGISRDIITDLSKFGGLFVIAADTSFKLADLSAPRPRQRGIAVRYVLTGSVQWVGEQVSEQVRVNVQLLETEFGRHVWAERFDRPADDLLKLQNEIARRVVDVIGPVGAAQGKLRQVELDRLARIPTESLQAYDHYVEGVVRFERGENLLARESFARATALDPLYARAFAMATWTYLVEVWDGRAEAPGALLAEAEVLAERALMADPGEAYAHWALGAVRLFQRRHDESIAAYRKALELNPNGQDLLMYLGWALTYVGKADEGLTYMEQAIDRNPYHPGWYLFDVAWGHFVALRYQSAIDALKGRNPTTIGSRELLALCYAMLGRDAEASREITIVLREKPHFSVELAATLEPFARKEDLQHYIKALRAAGVPERAGG